jgi:hypothetical protein
MLRFAQHDKTEDVIPSVSEESSTWMLRCAQHDKSGKRGCCTWHDKVGMANLTLWSLSFARRGDGNLTLSLCDVPLLRKERDVLAKAKTG